MKGFLFLRNYEKNYVRILIENILCDIEHTSAL